VGQRNRASGELAHYGQSTAMAENRPTNAEAKKNRDEAEHQEDGAQQAVKFLFESRANQGVVLSGWRECL
jgi:hypothetical protein